MKGCQEKLVNHLKDTKVMQRHETFQRLSWEMNGEGNMDSPAEDEDEVQREAFWKSKRYVAHVVWIKCKWLDMHAWYGGTRRRRFGWRDCYSLPTIVTSSDFVEKKGEKKIEWILVKSNEMKRKNKRNMADRFNNNWLRET